MNILQAIIEYIPIFFGLLWGYKMWKMIVRETESSEFFMKGMFYGGLFVLSIPLSFILTEILSLTSKN